MRLLFVFALSMCTELISAQLYMYFLNALPELSKKPDVKISDIAKSKSMGVPEDKPALNADFLIHASHMAVVNANQSTSSSTEIPTTTTTMTTTTTSASAVFPTQPQQSQGSNAQFGQFLPRPFGAAQAPESFQAPQPVINPPSTNFQQPEIIIGPPSQQPPSPPDFPTVPENAPPALIPQQQQLPIFQQSQPFILPQETAPLGVPVNFVPPQQAPAFPLGTPQFPPQPAVQPTEQRAAFPVPNEWAQHAVPVIGSNSQQPSGLPPTIAVSPMDDPSAVAVNLQQTGSIQANGPPMSAQDFHEYLRRIPRIRQSQSQNSTTGTHNRRNRNAKR